MRPIGVSRKFFVAFAAGTSLVTGGSFATGASASPTPPPQAGAAAASSLPGFGNPRGHDYVPPAGQAVSTRRPNRIIGNGRPASCTSAAVVKAVAAGGVIIFNCGPRPVTITMNATAKVVNTSHQVVLDGGGKVTLDGGGKHQILYLDTCDRRQRITTPDCYDQQWPSLIVQNITFAHGDSSVQ